MLFVCSNSKVSMELIVKRPPEPHEILLFVFLQKDAIQTGMYCLDCIVSTATNLKVS